MPNQAPRKSNAGRSISGKLKGYTAKEVSTDAAKLVESLLEVNKLYKPDGQPVMFDLQIEAEILGCDLVWSEDAPPTVASHPLADSTDIPEKIPGKNEGRIPMAIKAMTEMKSRVGADTARITSYNVCYTKLLRSLIASFSTISMG